MKALMGILGVVLALSLAGTVAAAPPKTVNAGQLTVGVDLPSEGFQVGVVKGSSVLLARGLEIDLAREIAKRLELGKTLFVQSRFDRLFSSGEKPWDLAVAQITITEQRKATAQFSIPYMKADEGVLMAQTITKTPRTIAELKPLRLCALAKSTGAKLIENRIKPDKPAKNVGNVEHLMLDLQTGHCDAVVYDAPSLGTLKARAPLRYGAFAGVIRTNEHYGIALPKSSKLTGRVNKVLQGLKADGTIERLKKKWLTANVSTLPVLR
jgi:polar amino acid transport system substrate-binding protein